jgi:tripartite-type tricarboxylate transporter receptor subunit TctC
MKALLFFLLASLSQLALAFPDKPVRVVVPWPAGGASDTLARILAAEVSTILKQPVHIDNRVGASGTIATEYVAREKPDGYTLLWAISNHATNHELFKVNYDPIKDFAPVGQMAASKYWLLVHPSVPAKTLPEFASYVKGLPQPLPYASAGNGTLQHLGMELLLGELGLKMIHVPYKGTAPAVNDLLAGHVKVTFEATTTTVDFVREGKLRSLGIASANRLGAVPEVPTLAEGGLPGVIIEGITGLLAPARTPPEVIATLNAAYNQALSLPHVRERMTAMGLTPTPGTAQSYGQTLNAMIPKFTAILKKSGGKID